jgi:hypothetical protein
MEKSSIRKFFIISFVAGRGLAYTVCDSRRMLMEEISMTSSLTLVVP